MKTTYKQVTVELHTTIDDNGQMEYNSLKETGKYYQRNHVDVLTFQEQTEDGDAIDNFITIQPDKATIKRAGDITMNQQFRPGRATENVFRHPYGTMHMETFTESLTHQALTDDRQGRLEIAYTVKLNGEEARNHLLTLTYNEE
jgi:uncharacterized beta-barrel protein YwiB (DUF1934 family)